MKGFGLKSLSMEDSSAMFVPFSLEQIAEVVTGSDGNKSPRPDGFNFSFFKRFGGFLKGRSKFSSIHFSLTPHSLEASLLILWFQSLKLTPLNLLRVSSYLSYRFHV